MSSHATDLSVYVKSSSSSVSVRWWTHASTVYKGIIGVWPWFS